MSELRPLTDEESAEIERKNSLAICPTCKGRIGDASLGYKLDGKTHPCDCQMQIALYARYRLGNIGEHYMRLDWDDFCGEPEADRFVREYIDKYAGMKGNGKGLVFSSKNRGVGKTWAATHIGKELIKRGRKVYFITFIDMVQAFIHWESRVLVERMRDTGLLILDEIRAGISEAQRGLYADQLEAIIRDRTNDNKPTIFTTNLTEPEFEQNFEAIYSLQANRQKWVVMDGQDWRRRSATGEEEWAMALNGEIRPIT